MKLKRIKASIIDFVLLIFIINLIGFVLTQDILFSSKIQNILYILLFISLLIKDLIFKNQSIGKRLMNIMVKNNDETIPSVLKIMLRNITLILWPIEGIILLVLNRRIADILFQTKVVEKTCFKRN